MLLDNIGGGSTKELVFDKVIVASVGIFGVGGKMILLLRLGDCNCSFMVINSVLFLVIVRSIT